MKNSQQAVSKAMNNIWDDLHDLHAWIKLQEDTPVYKQILDELTQIMDKVAEIGELE